MTLPKEFTDKLRFLIIELSKFRKTLSELVTVQDKLLFSLKHMDKLTERPEIMSEELFQLMYEIARINKLTQRDMKTYNRSIEKYDEVLQAMSFAEKEGEKRGKRRGKREGIEIGEKRGIEIGIERERIKTVKIYYDKLHMSSEEIAQLTGASEEWVCTILSSKRGLSGSFSVNRSYSL
jgi:hypothetical protein